MNISKSLIILIFTVVAGSGPTGHSNALAADPENCLMCHKYPSMARVGEDGLVRNYHVDEHIYLNSLHGDVRCRGCHAYIKKFPHDQVTEKVNCANECHIKPPFADTHFSHGKIVKVFNNSDHAVRPGDSPLMKKSKPDCKYCHVNPLYKRVSEDKIAYDKTLSRCFNCHNKKGVTEAYLHMTHRLRHKTSRSSQEIVALCGTNCHGDTALMKKLDAGGLALHAVETYKSSIHGKMTTLGSEESADCISCHASSLIHDIRGAEDPESTINENNLLNLCRNCHEKINAHFVKIAVHPTLAEPKNPILFVISNLILRAMMYGTVFGLMGLLFLETFRRRKNGAAMKIKNGTTWRKAGGAGANNLSEQKEKK